MRVHAKFGDCGMPVSGVEANVLAVGTAVSYMRIIALRIRKVSNEEVINQKGQFDTLSANQ